MLLHNSKVCKDLDCMCKTSQADAEMLNEECNDQLQELEKKYQRTEEQDETCESLLPNNLKQNSD